MGSESKENLPILNVKTGYMYALPTFGTAAPELADHVLWGSEASDKAALACHCGRLKYGRIRAATQGPIGWNSRPMLASEQQKSLHVDC